MQIKRCAGGVIYFQPREIFLMTSKKWGNGKLWLVPGGEINPGETSEHAFVREITNEELGIELTDIVFAGNSVKKPSNDFYIPNVEFHFASYYARALSKDVKPNQEILDSGWFPLNFAFYLPLLDSTKDLLNQYRHNLKE